MHHTYGLHVFCFRVFLAPMTLVLLPRWNMDVALKLIPKSVNFILLLKAKVKLMFGIFISFLFFHIPCAARYKITHIFLIPSLVHQLISTPKTKKTDLSSLVWAFSGAAYLPDHLAKGFTRLISEKMTMSESRTPSSHRLPILILI